MPETSRIRRITLSGLPGTGTSTLAKRLEATLGWTYVYAGSIFRQEAAKRGMSLQDFGALCEADPSVDQALDAHQQELLRSQENLILEGRMAGILATNLRDTLRVQLTCALEERLRRITERDGGDVEMARQATLQREASEQARYERYYGANPNDPSHYDLILDSTSLNPDQLLELVQARMETGA